MSLLERFRNRRDEYDDYGGYDDDGERRRWVVPVGVAVVAIAAAVTLGPRIVSGISSSGDDDRSSTTDSTISTEPTTSVASDPTTSTEPLVASEPPVPPSSSAATIVAPSTSARPVTVVALQTVPPVRDVIVLVDGVAMATDGLGKIAIGGLDAATTIEVVGREAVPALQQVEFTGWGDGSTSATRTIGDLDGAVAQIGVAVSSRVVVEVVGSNARTFDGAQVDVTSDIGPVSLDADTPTWVVASRAVPVAGGLAVQQIVYVPTAITLSDGSTLEAVGQLLTPTPEALWSVAVDSP